MTLDDLNDEARVWVFGRPSPLSDEQSDSLTRETQRFLRGWSAHGAALRAAAAVLDNTFLVVALEEGSDASGCSIDDLFRFVRQMGMLDSGRVFYRAGDGVRSATRSEFAGLELNDDTIVFDTTVGRLGDLRRNFAKRLADSWHVRIAPLR